MSAMTASKYALVVGPVLRKIIDLLEIKKENESEYFCGYEIIDTQFIQNGMIWDKEANNIIAEIDVVDELGKLVTR
jgi:hypothetical protein